MDLLERRGFLVTTVNPDKNLDYIVTLEGHLPHYHGQSPHITLRYVPDRMVLDSKSFGQYLEALAQVGWNLPEDLAVTVITDINNQVVSRWMQVTLKAPELLHHAVETHSVVIEDRQPGWDNPGLLGRLSRI
jgi:hypothetical protein